MEAFFHTIKAANTGIRQLNLIKMSASACVFQPGFWYSWNLEVLWTSGFREYMSGIPPKLLGMKFANTILYGCSNTDTWIIA